MITVATFSILEEAHLARTRLEAVGIPAYVLDENIQLDWVHSNAMGGVRLQVDDDLAEEAKEFLAADAEQTAPELSEEQIAEADEPEQVEEETWPKADA